ncbi:MAG: hypothetical protein ACRDEA_20785 [Microcystaceae cyanobacterium]
MGNGYQVSGVRRQKAFMQKSEVRRQKAFMQKSGVRSQWEIYNL